MSNYTPGPWFYNGTELLGADGTKVVFTSHKIALGSVTSFPSGPANAALAIAAPDLLVALQAVVSVADRATAEFDMARAAIAKATGCTPLRMKGGDL